MLNVSSQNPFIKLIFKESLKGDKNGEEEIVWEEFQNRHLMWGKMVISGIIFMCDEKEKLSWNKSHLVVTSYFSKFIFPYGIDGSQLEHQVYAGCQTNPSNPIPHLFTWNLFSLTCSLKMCPQFSFHLPLLRATCRSQLTSQKHVLAGWRTSKIQSVVTQLKILLQIELALQGPCLLTDFFLCFSAVNVTSPQFSGTDEFGFTSFIAYSMIQNISSYCEFRLKFTLADPDKATKDNLIFFTGQKGQGKNRLTDQHFNLSSSSFILIYCLLELVRVYKA